MDGLSRSDRASMQIIPVNILYSSESCVHVHVVQYMYMEVVHFHHSPIIVNPNTHRTQPFPMSHILTPFVFVLRQSGGHVADV